MVYDSQFVRGFKDLLGLFLHVRACFACPLISLAAIVRGSEYPCLLADRKQVQFRFRKSLYILNSYAPQPCNSSLESNWRTKVLETKRTSLPSPYPPRSSRNNLKCTGTAVGGSAHQPLCAFRWKHNHPKHFPTDWTGKTLRREQAHHFQFDSCSRREHPYAWLANLHTHSEC